VNMLPVCRILCSMGHFDQKVLGSIFWKLDKYETNHSSLIQQKTLWRTSSSSRTSFLFSCRTSASGIVLCVRTLKLNKDI
jgi:hypothetical protein